MVFKRRPNVTKLREIARTTKRVNEQQRKQNVAKIRR